MSDENGRLRKIVAEKDYEINYLKKKADEKSSALAGKKRQNIAIRQAFIFSMCFF